ncbi:hypothetical protein [Cupriavidus oxalaticus]|jgi:hypothetical protein|uniref:hypothetical protein n=1 Tax=Cupriavidus oxalaticus TaxID=96344 RepID=UPI0040343B6A
MTTEFAERPRFFEGQYLGAEDLQALLRYFSTLLARHHLGSHSWGIASGIELVYQDSPQGTVEAYLTPGLATDGYGRAIVVAEPFPLDAGLFAGQPAGLVNVWIRYDEAAGQGVRPGFEVCGATDAYARVIESFLVEVGERKTIETRQSGVALGDDSYGDAREAPGALLPLQPIAPDGSVPAQRFPGADDPSLWLIPVGRVLWQGGALQQPTPASATQSRLFRRHAGWIGEALHGTGGLLRLRGRWIPRAGGTPVEQLCEADQPTAADLVFCASDPDTPHFREPVWLDADTRARGHLRYYGTRAEWVDAGGTDYLAQGTVTALQRAAPSAVDGVDLRVLLGQPQGTAGPTRLTLGAATPTGTDPCAVGFSYTAGVAIQHDGRVGIGSTDKALALPLTVRALAANGGLVGLEGTGGALAWQVNLGPAKNGLNVTQDDPTLSNLFIEAASGNVGIGTLAPGARLDIQQVPSPQGNAVGNGKWLQMGNSGAPDAGQAWFQYGPQLAPLLVLSDLDDPPRVQFQQVGNGNEAAAQFSSWVGQARSNSPDLALFGGSVGIGTLTPSRTLHVLGNEIHSGGGGAGLSFENRETGAFIANPGNGERWVWYASGGNARLWSNGDKLTVTPAGRMGLGTAAPASALEVRGAIRLGDNGDYFAVGGVAEMRIVAGRASAGGGSAGTGWSATRTSTGHYTVSFAPAFTATPVVVASLVDSANDDQAGTVRNVGPGGFTLVARDVTPPSEGSFVDNAFHFIAYGPRN